MNLFRWKWRKQTQSLGWFKEAFFIPCWSSVQKIIHYLRKTTSWIWASNMDTTFEKIYNCSRKCAMPSHKIGGWFSSHELLRKAKKPNLPSLVYRRPRSDMIEIFKHFYFYDNCPLPENFRPRNRPSRKHDYQLVWKSPKDCVRVLQANFFYFQTIKTWNELPN